MRAFIGVLAVVTSGAANVMAADVPDISGCNPALVQNTDIGQLSSTAKYAWLSLIDEKSYEGAQKTIKSSGDAELAGLIQVGNAEASYGEFSEKRKEYLELKKYSMESALSQSWVRYTTQDGARAEWLECVKALTKAPGIYAWFTRNDKDGAVLNLRYVGEPGTKRTLKLQWRGVKGRAPKSIEVVHDEEKTILVDRILHNNVLVTVNSKGYGTSAAAPALTTGVKLSVIKGIDNDKGTPLSPCHLIVTGAHVEVEVAGLPSVDEYVDLVFEKPTGADAYPRSWPRSVPIGRQVELFFILVNQAQAQVWAGDAKAAFASFSAGGGECGNHELTVADSTILVKRKQNLGGAPPNR